MKKNKKLCTFFNTAIVKIKNRRIFAAAYNNKAFFKTMVW